MAVRKDQQASGDASTDASTMEQAREQVTQVTGEAREKATSAVQTQVDERSTQAGEQLRSFGEALRRTGEQLGEEGNETPARIAEGVATRVERAGSYLEQTDGNRMLSDIESFGRRRPWAIAAGGLVLGLVASRFLKASSENRYASSEGGWGTQSASVPPQGLTQRPALPEESLSAQPAPHGYA